MSDPAFDEIVGEVKAPETAAPAPVGLEQRAADWQSKADAVVEAALLGVPDTVAGVQLRPFSTARGSLLRRIGNEFVQGVSLKDIADPFLSVGKFLIIMSSELKEARRLVANETELEDKAYDLLEQLPISDIGETVRIINAYVHREMSNQVHGTVPEAPEGSAVPEGPKN